MLSSGDFVRKVLMLVETGYFRQASVHLADDFRLSGPLPGPLDKAGFLDLMQSLLGAFPDWKFRVADVRGEDGVQRLKLHIKGTNTGRIDVPSLGIHDVAPTGKHIELPEEPCEARLSGGKLSSLKIDPVPGGGMQGLFAQLGMELPVPVGA